MRVINPEGLADSGKVTAVISSALGSLSEVAEEEEAD